jgi:uncharacterized protein YcaQ
VAGPCLAGKQHANDQGSIGPGSTVGEVDGCRYRHSMGSTISAAAARRIALAAQGFGRPRPASVGTRQLNDVVGRLGLLQLDSVNVFERSHYSPVFARLGSFDKARLDALTFGRSARYVETWAHVASLVPRDTWPLWRWKMRARKAKDLADEGGWAAHNGTMLDWLRT